MIQDKKISKNLDLILKISNNIGFLKILIQTSRPKIGKFESRPFIEIERDILVAEIKMATDTSNGNMTRLRYARQHFSGVNTFVSEHKYYFKSFSASSYDLFPHDLREEKYRTFRQEVRRIR